MKISCDDYTQNRSVCFTFQELFFSFPTIYYTKSHEDGQEKSINF